MRAKSSFYAICRDVGLMVPMQVVWGSHDPLATLDMGLGLFRLVAARQRAAQFHVINRAGAFPFREEPEAFIRSSRRSARRRSWIKRHGSREARTARLTRATGLPITS